MKILIYKLLTFVLFISSAYSQQKDSLIQLYPGLCDTLELFNRDYFELFQNIDGFEYATFYIRKDEQLISKVIYSAYGFQKDTIFIQSLTALGEARLRIGQIDEENNKKYESPKEVFITTKSGNEYECKLEMFDKNSLYLLSDMNLYSDEADDFRFKISLSDIQSLNVVEGTEVSSTAGWGALVGGITSLSVALVLLSQPGDNATPGTFISAFIYGGLLGGVIGLIVSLFLEPDYDTIQIESHYDLLKIKDYAKYYFQYDESVEEEYVEVK